ncbi:hypothetical protein TNIN_483951 [Trichonephila inaurata madagascariensis]|uniref:Uncharacterized protein n=1 Tax=Trichonephila inaurata madagascariensis TaxID=2747483 RepID=A0A8X7CL25_9ARAC|nr:hypothetical protein TNIN_483951 [Trichonephila inaurata madagascariensis]
MHLFDDAKKSGRATKRSKSSHAGIRKKIHVKKEESEESSDDEYEKKYSTKIQKSGRATKRSKSSHTGISKKIHDGEKENKEESKESSSEESSEEESSDDDGFNSYLVDDVTVYDFRKKRTDAYESESDDEYEKKYSFFSKMDSPLGKHFGASFFLESNSVWKLTPGRPTEGSMHCFKKHCSIVGSIKLL